MTRLFIGEKSFFFSQQEPRLINVWVYDTSLQEIALKVLHVMPALLLQNPKIT